MRYDEERNELVVGNRRFPVHIWRNENHDFGSLTDEVLIPMLDFAMRVRQAILAFENKWGLSILWGAYSYSSNYILKSPDAFTEEPEMVEVGIFSPVPRMIEGTVYTDEDGEPKVVPDYYTDLVIDPFGYLDADDLLKLIDHVSKLPSSGLNFPKQYFSLDELFDYLGGNCSWTI